MEPTQSSEPAAPKPATPPVMDIKAPPQQPHQTAPEPVKAAPPEAGDPLPESVELKKPQVKSPKPPKAPRSGVGLAIFATIIIVLGLGAMFVYAYLRMQGINVF